MKYAVCPVTKFLVEAIKDLESVSAYYFQIHLYEHIYLFIYLFLFYHFLTSTDDYGALRKVSILELLILFPGNAARIQ